MYFSCLQNDELRGDAFTTSGILAAFSMKDSIFGLDLSNMRAFLLYFIGVYSRKFLIFITGKGVTNNLVTVTAQCQAVIYYAAQSRHLLSEFCLLLACLWDILGFLHLFRGDSRESK